MVTIYRKVISIDPGEATGISISSKDEKTGDWSIDFVDAVSKVDLYKILENTENVDLVIYETYKLYADKAKAMIGNEFITVQIIGVIKYICEKRKIKCIQSATANKAFWSNEKLKKLGLYITIDHKRDAIRHFLHWLYFIQKDASVNDLL